MSANWEAIEGALADWVEVATGLTAVWANQNAAQPDEDYVSLNIDGPLIVGIDSVRQITDLSRPAGQEVELRVIGEREGHLLVQAFTEAAHGVNAANKILCRLQVGLSLPSVVAGFEAAGIHVFDVGEVQNIPTLVEADVQGRATMRVRFYFRDSVSEFTGYIANVAVTQTET